MELTCYESVLENAELMSKRKQWLFLLKQIKVPSGQHQIYLCRILIACCGSIESNHYFPHMFKASDLVCCTYLLYSENLCSYFH